jgi:calcineurin-like phosphoesterase family protein
MTTWFTSDEHYGHAGVIPYCGRPFADVDDMREGLIARHNAVVQDGDEVWHLGDFAWKTSLVAGIVSRLRGVHNLVPGNHDACHGHHSKWETAARRYVRDGFAFVIGADQPHYVLGPGRGFAVFHLPPAEDADPRYPEMRPAPEEMAAIVPLLLHGHVHERYRVRRAGPLLCINVGVDQWGYAPVSLETLLELAAAGGR